MKHQLLPFIINDFSFVYKSFCIGIHGVVIMVAPHFFSGTKGSNMHALLIENYKVVCVVVQEESRAL